ncbi:MULTISPECIES: ABC transporter permease [unclassified Shinella]|jgi:simple sugar transport system permease protein|uniref:ABC transporter permease n=1 Tax=unclassified Shinella TaxID=2643062 RepID=UPI0003C55EE9|nr:MULTISPECIES: ABC transporter permease [unclassified Shinella]EYR77874.1 putative ABC transporter, permease [Shinella sp. DD12]KNY17974.1 ABC transporter [Shinella sp. SUS2]KOC75633.1 ABC transporter [Shinella sp. GWS1]MCO5149573.1 ABC transporter permease [Shinella sp.]MDC7262522.1 ABC transporter permease [Shinella sp. HY16]
MKDSLITVLRSLVFVIFALVLCALVFQLAGYNAPVMLWAVLDGAFLRSGAIEQSLRWALPLFITAVGVGISFRAGFFNIGAQGQFYVGAICAAFAAEALKGGPAVLVIPALLLAGMLGGALWALWPGLLRLRSGTDEVITTLMGNFMAGLLLVYVTAGPLKDPSGSGQQASSRPLDAAYRISDSLGLSPTIIAIAAIVGILMWLLVNRTAFGVLASLAGRNGTMVEWQGARLWKLGLSSFLISGALAGLAGTIEFMGPNGRIASGFLPAHGFTAILIALVANLSVVGTAVAAVFFGGLASAALYLPIMAGLPAAAIDIINAAIALFITARSKLVDRVLRFGGRSS